MKESFRPDKNSVALAGEFAVLSQLALRNFNASLTLGHTKGVDILISDPKSGRLRRLEVKTSYSKRKKSEKTSKIFGTHFATWMVNAKAEKDRAPHSFYCFVAYREKTNEFRFFIVPSEIVAAYLRTEHRFWLTEKKAKHGKGKSNDLRTFRMGLDNADYPIPTPRISESENRWELLFK